MKIQLCIDAILVAETEVETSQDGLFRHLANVDARLIFRLDPMQAALEPRARSADEEPRPYYYNSTLINVLLIP
jgi:hypothetical protein